MPNEKSMANLKLQKKGDPPLPGAGRPKGSQSLKTVLARIFALKEDVTPEMLPILKRRTKLTQLEILTYMQVAKARKGDTRAYQELMDRGFGKPEQTIANEFPEGTVIEVSVGKPVVPVSANAQNAVAPPAGDNKISEQIGLNVEGPFPSNPE